MLFVAVPIERFVLGRHLENPGEIAHVEEVVELGRGRKHLGLHRAPEADGHLGQVSNHLRKYDVASIPRRRGISESAGNG